MDRSARHFDTIVIGAGISGLACARRLYQHERWRQAGRLCVLEARDRIGGRIESVHVNGCRLDTGANWIHGVGTEQEPNPLMQILPEKRVRKLSGSVMFRPWGNTASDDVKGSEDDYEWVKVSSPVPPSSSPTMTMNDLVIPSADAGKLTASMWGTVGTLHELAHEKSSEDAKASTVLEAIGDIPTFKKAFKELPQEYHQTLRALPQFIENMEAAPLTAKSAEHDQGKPGMSLLEFKIDDFDGEQVFLQDGYAAVAMEVAKELNEAALIGTGVGVLEIDWTAEPIEIKTTEGPLTANDVVCTIPLGVLKWQGATLFEPALPQEYREAISSLGFGTLDKIFMVYSRPWWTEQPYKSIIKKGFCRSPVNEEAGESTDTSDDGEPDFFMGFTDRLSGIEIHEDGTSSEGLRLLSLTNLHSLTGFPVLGSFISCKNARDLERMPNSTAGDTIQSELTSWFGREPPQPDAVYVTRWASDMWARGSYSHMIAGLSERKHREQFQRPLRSGKGSMLRFAGEHTSSDHFATVHGALISGWDAADAIIEDRG